MATTTKAPPSPVKDKDYDLVKVLEISLENAWRMETYAQDAEREGDKELANWFREIQKHSMKAGDQGKMMLAERLQREKG